LWVLTFPIWFSVIMWGIVALGVLIFSVIIIWLDSK
jgi:hypothetical protein